VLLQEDTFGSLRHCASLARKLKGFVTKYSAYYYDREAFPVVDDMHTYLDVNVSQSLQIIQPLPIY
jgi:hypothetical protein